MMDQLNLPDTKSDWELSLYKMLKNVGDTWLQPRPKGNIVKQQQGV
jgi:hypothetical protein